MGICFPATPLLPDPHRFFQPPLFARKHYGIQYSASGGRFSCHTVPASCLLVFEAVKLDGPWLVCRMLKADLYPRALPLCSCSGDKAISRSQPPAALRVKRTPRAGQSSWGKAGSVVARRHMHVMRPRIEAIGCSVCLTRLDDSQHQPAEGVGEGVEAAGKPANLAIADGHGQSTCQRSGLLREMMLHHIPHPHDLPPRHELPN